MRNPEKPYYVLLTGGKNNAGDFLIKYRAKELFREIRPDREIIDVDAWTDRTDQLLEIYNGAQAIVLTGGPSLRPNMYPGIYKALGNLDDIKVSIVTLAVGWRIFPGEWYQTYEYKFSGQTLKLLDRIEKSGYYSSVRDYHTMNVLMHKGFKSFKMTGCAALFDVNVLRSEAKDQNEVKTIGFSLGVSFVDNFKHEVNFKKVLLSLKEKFKKQKLIVAFHHSLDQNQFEESYQRQSKFYEKHLAFSKWLKENDIEFRDISGSAENLINFYDQIDLHIGYRVHAHIYMCSQRKLSVLIAEDGRGKALKDVINGLVLENEFSNYSAVIGPKNGLKNKILSKLNLNPSKVLVNDHLNEDLIHNLEMEINNQYSRIKKSHFLINEYWKDMSDFLNQLP